MAVNMFCQVNSHVKVISITLANMAANMYIYIYNFHFYDLALIS